MLAGALGLCARLDPLAHTCALVHGLDETNRSVNGIGTVVAAHDRLDGLGGLVCIVERNGANVVVQNVGLDDTVEQVATDEAKLTVDGCSGALDKGPLLAGVVRQGRVGVLEEGDSDCEVRKIVSRKIKALQEIGKRLRTQPVVDPEVWQEVPNQHVVPAKLLDEQAEHGGGQTDTDVAEDNEPSILLLKQRAAGVEVADTATVTIVLALATALTLTLVVVVAGNVGQEVVGPTNELLTEKHEKGVNGSLLGQLRQLVDEFAETAGLLLAGAGHKDHIALHVASGLVVLAVRHLPAEVGNEQSRVDDPADGVVVQLGGGEGLVTALVGKDPETSPKETLHEGVQTPENEADGVGGDCLGRDKVVKKSESGSEASHVTQDISHTEEAVTLEAVFGDGISNVLDGVVGNLKGVAVGVDQLAIVLLGVVGIERGHGGKRSRRGRSTRRVEGRRRGSRGRRDGLCGASGDGPLHGRLAFGRDSC